MGGASSGHLIACEDGGVAKGSSNTDRTPANKTVCLRERAVTDGRGGASDRKFFLDLR